MSDAVKLAYDSGFQVASHTWAHRRLIELSEEESKLTVTFLITSAPVRW